jgi:hypothetical protein
MLILANGQPTGQATDRLMDQVWSLSPAARELAIQTGMELHDALAEERKSEREEQVRRVVGAGYNEVYDKVREEERKRHEAVVREQTAKLDTIGQELKTWGRAYMDTYLDWFAGGGSPRSLASTSAAIKGAIDDFHDSLELIENRVGKEVSHFERSELLYGALRWLATTYRDAKTGGRSCPDLDESCRKASGFRYIAHQSDNYGTVLFRLRGHLAPQNGPTERAPCLLG